MRKILSYLAVFTIAGLTVYLDYLMIQEVAWWAASHLFPNTPRLPVHYITRYFFFLTGAFILFMHLSYFGFYLYVKAEGEKGEDPKYYPKVSIVIPAYNEAKTIGRLLESIRYQDYPRENVEVIVVDDGSSDGTGEVAARLGAKVIVHERNMGKVKSLEDGIRMAGGEVIITMDADSYLGTGSSLRHVIGALYRSGSTGIATGVIRVEEKTRRILERLQALEFLHSFEIGRRVQSHLDWLLIVPGAFSAFRGRFLKSILELRRPLPSNILAEDFLLAMEAYRAGLTSRLEPNSIVYTEPKREWGSLYRQRLRWYYGGLQVLAEYSDMILNRRYGDRGVFLFLHMIILEYIIPLIFLIGVIILPILLAMQSVLGISLLAASLPPKLVALIFAIVYLLQYLPGILSTAIAVGVERGSSALERNLPAVVLYHLVYNPILAVAKVDAMARFFKGVIQKW